jgi:hypothetical protein
MKALYIKLAMSVVCLLFSTTGLKAKVRYRLLTVSVPVTIVGGSPYEINISN